MTEKQLKTIYVAACDALGRMASEPQFAQWKAVLSRFEQAEVKAALEAWWADTTPAQGNLLGKTIGATMPGASDLRAKVLAGRERKFRLSNFRACGKDGCYCGEKRVRIGDGIADFDIVKCQCRIDWENARKDVAA